MRRREFLATVPLAMMGLKMSDWEAKAHTVSNDDIIARAIRTGGFLFCGDSISMQSGYDLTVALGERGYNVAVHWWNGIPTPPTVDWMAATAQRLGGLPPNVLMATGSNDIFDPDAMAPALAKFRELQDAYGFRAWWVDVFVRRSGSEAWDLGTCMPVNNQIWALQDRASIVGWAKFLGHPSKQSYRVSTYLLDGVHPTEAGADARNALILTEIDKMTGV